MYEIKQTYTQPVGSKRKSFCTKTIYTHMWWKYKCICVFFPSCAVSNRKIHVPSLWCGKTMMRNSLSAIFCCLLLKAITGRDTKIEYKWKLKVSLCRVVVYIWRWREKKEENIHPFPRSSSSKQKFCSSSLPIVWGLRVYKHLAPTLM